MIREVLTWPDPRLRQRAAPVEVFDAALRALAEDLLETMYDSNGIGLAATQVGEMTRVLVMDCGAPWGPMVLVNPTITAQSEEWAVMEEGCLSVPDVFAEVERPEFVIVRYQDLDGEHRTLEADDLLSVCVQHELDHLNGKVFIQRLGRLERKAAMEDYADGDVEVTDAAG